MSKYTKGPWEVNGKRPYIIACTDRDCIDDGCIITAGVISNGGRYHIGDEKVTKANARLIAKSPTMYEALKTIINLPDNIACPSVKNLAKEAIGKVEEFDGTHYEKL